MPATPDISALIGLRRALHAAPDLAGAEAATAQAIAAFLHPTAPDQVITGLGGHGLALVYDSGKPGPRILFRAELDALPIVETGLVAHHSRRAGVAHLCGHDGHMAGLAGLGLMLARDRPARGCVILLFQPAEETGAGARAVLADPRFDTLRPDWAFALHNMPGLPLGAVAIAAGPASCASVGLHLHFSGHEAHAAQPETGRSPAPALARLMAGLAPHALPASMGPDFRLATLCHMRLGTPAFGIAPGEAEAHITLRTCSDAALDGFERDIRALVQDCAQGLDLTITRHDHFNATQNDPQAAALVASAANALGMAQTPFAFPMRASEDFGAFSAITRTALFFLGAGKAQPALHNPDYDFPDDLIAPGCAIFAEILRQIMAS